MVYNAILFDLDGVVIDTHQAVTEFWLALASQYDVQLSQADFRQHIYGCPMQHTFEVLFPHLDERQRQAVFTYERDYEINQTYTAMPGVMTLLHTLKQHGIPTALVTSADTWKVEVVERQLGLAGLFATYITISEIRRGKPHPDGYLLAAQRLQQPAQHCLVFEDAVSGVKAAVAAGATCIGVQSAEAATALLAVGAVHTIPDFTTVTVLDHPANSRPAALSLQPGMGVTLPLS